MSKSSASSRRTDVQAHLRNADHFASVGANSQAIALYRMAAEAAHQGGDDRTALSAYRSVARLEGPASPARVKMGEILLQQRRITEGAGVLDDVANEMLAVGRSAEALCAWLSAAKAEPTLERWTRLGDWYLHFGMQAEAIDAFHQATESLFSRRDIDGFISVAKRLLELVPDHVPTLRRLIRAQLRRRRLHDAVASIRALLVARPRDPDALERMAETFGELGRHDKAAEVVKHLARMFVSSKGGADEALRLVRRGLAWNPRDPELHQLLERLEPSSAKSSVGGEIVLDEDVPDLDLAEFADITPPSGEVIAELDDEDIELAPTDEEEDDALRRYATAGGRDPRFALDTLGLG